MATRKLTAIQEEVLKVVPQYNWFSCFDLARSKVSIQTLKQLAEKDYLEIRYDIGSEFSPRTGIKFRRKG